MHAVVSHNTPAGAVWRMRGEPYYRHVKSHPKQGGRGEYEDDKGHAAVIVQSIAIHSEAPPN